MLWLTAIILFFQKDKKKMEQVLLSLRWCLKKENLSFLKTKYKCKKGKSLNRFKNVTYFVQSLFYFIFIYQNTCEWSIFCIFKYIITYKTFYIVFKQKIIFIFFFGKWLIILGYIFAYFILYKRHHLYS